jgi:NAD(P)H-dependent flavin oxidoreductase YrpB (nitropropane dioxygenase family)
VPSADALNKTSTENIYATVLMNSFTGRVVRVRVAKKPGELHMMLRSKMRLCTEKINEDLLSDAKQDETEEAEEGGGGLWNTISR